MMHIQRLLEILYSPFLYGIDKEKRLIVEQVNKYAILSENIDKNKRKVHEALEKRTKEDMAEVPAETTIHSMDKYPKPALKHLHKIK